jgi:hypothetical protein
MVDDYAFITETRNHWYFGANNSGDMRLPCNIAGAWERAKGVCVCVLCTHSF